MKLLQEYQSSELFTIDNQKNEIEFLYSVAWNCGRFFSLKEQHKYSYEFFKYAGEIQKYQGQVTITNLETQKTCFMLRIYCLIQIGEDTKV